MHKIRHEADTANGCEASVSGEDDGRFLLNEYGYFNKGNVDFMAFSDFYPAGHQSGVTMIMNGRRLIANGDIRFEQTPGQWQPVPKQLGRIEDREKNRIVTSLKYPDMEAHLHGFNPIIYPDFEFEYEVVTTGTGTGLDIVINLDRPVDADFLGKVCFNLELFPGELFDRAFISDGKTGIFPRHPNGPTFSQRTNYEHTGKIKPMDCAHADREKLSGYNRGYNPIVADDIIAEPYASGKKFTICPEDRERRVSVSTEEGEIRLYDGRMNHNNGWFVLSEEIPAGRTKEAIHWIITPATDCLRTEAPVVQVSSLGYHTKEIKTAVVELDRRNSDRLPVEIYRIEENGPRLIRSAEGSEWGDFLRYRYLTYDFSDIAEEGLYSIKYGSSSSSLFMIKDDIYDRGVWQPVLEYFLPIQMCHMRVSDKYRVWHGRCHHDDARMAPVSYEQFDGAAQGPSTMTKYKPGDHVPGLNAGGWHDAGDFDLRIESQTGEMYILSSAYEEFNVYWDETTIDQKKQIVEIHQPDGKNDILEQIEHGALSVVGGYRSMGRLYHEIMCGDLRQYVLLGDPSTMTGGIPEDADERLVFTEDNPPRELLMAAHLAGSYRALKDINEEMASECLKIAKSLFEITKKHDATYVKNAYDPGECERDYYLGSKIQAACELLISTGEEKYRSFVMDNSDYIFARIDEVGWIVCRAIKFFSDEAFLKGLREALIKLNTQYEKESRETPYGIPYKPNIWGAGWAIQENGMKYYFLHKAFPKIFPKDMLFHSLQFILGCHPGSNTESFASGVGSRSATVAYGMNRADWSYIPGGVISGTALIRPDFPELLDFPFLWQQKEYVLGGGSSNYLFLVLAVRSLLQD